MAIRSDDDVNYLLGRPEGEEVDDATLEYARRLAKRQRIPWKYGEDDDDDLPVYVQRVLNEREARRAMHAAGISEEDRQRAQEEAFRARAEDILAIVYRGAVVGAAQAAHGRAAELERELLGLARSAQMGVDSPAGRALAKRALDPFQRPSRILHACIEMGKSVSDADVEAALSAPRMPRRASPPQRRNPSHPRAMRLLDALQRVAPELDAHARDVEDFADEDSVMRYTRRFKRAITDALGRHVGLSADWVNEAWPLDDDLFLFAEDDSGAYSVVRQQEEDGEGYTVDEVLIGGRPAYASDHRELIRILKKVA